MRKYLVLLNMVNASTRGVDSSPAKKLLNNHNSRNQTITRAVESPEPKKMENHELEDGQSTWSTNLELRLYFNIVFDESSMFRSHLHLLLVSLRQSERTFSNTKTA